MPILSYAAGNWARVTKIPTWTAPPWPRDATLGDMMGKIIDLPRPPPKVRVWEHIVLFEEGGGGGVAVRGYQPSRAGSVRGDIYVTSQSCPSRAVGVPLGREDVEEISHTRHVSTLDLSGGSVFDHHCPSPSGAAALLPGLDDFSGDVDNLCLGCICEAASDCDRRAGCVRDVCGLFKITRPYWVDAGTPAVDGDTADQPEAYPRCASDTDCSAKAVQNYMAKFKQDCNGDGKIDCLDYAAIHRMGGYGCKGELDAAYSGKVKACLFQWETDLFRSGGT
ncbi:hypothetical protein PR048_006894 [Dryococelus australis]|uniref:lysozyme n=1 Tax=Dryococelus australis TaxID=614101 RepID=A0ABQ9IC97_9NEOP|nr:hypothetical protein PR048_006894 [Dryococelus australis]